MNRPCTFLVPALFVFVSWFNAAELVHAQDLKLRNVIDGEIKAAWQREKITAPAAIADDATFLRRIYLDLISTIPTHDEAIAFLNDTDATKRDKLIAQLLDDPRFAAAQAIVWDQVLFGRNPPNSEATRKRDGFRAWLSNHFAKNEPYDRWVRSLLLAEEEGPELFYVQFQNKPEDLTEAFSKAFLGTQLQCARCHDHPYTPLTQKDFFGMTGFFVRLVVVDQGTTGEGNEKRKKFAIGEKSTGDVLFAGNMKELKPGKKGEPVKPKFLAGDPLAEPEVPKDFKEPEIKSGTKTVPKPQFSRKEKLAEWATAKENPFFAKAAVNRVWGQFMGRGIVHPIDNLGEDNKPAIPALLETLTKEFIAHDFDMKWLIREIVSSQTYQLASTGSGKEALPTWWERGRIRPLSAEEIQNVLKVASGDTTLKPGESSEYFLRYFGEPTNGQGDFQGSLNEHLFLNNSDNIRKYIRRTKGNLAQTIIDSKEPWETRVDHMFVTVLTRKPRESERAKFVAYLTADPKPESLVEEAIWVLMNMSEFRFNH